MFFDDFPWGENKVSKASFVSFIAVGLGRALGFTQLTLWKSKVESRHFPFPPPRDRQKTALVLFMGETGILLDRFVTLCGIGVANAFFFCFSLQVYSFVPIPGAQQHKRPRRRYEEIERMYKCGWNGCEKAYGTLNHLNAHVTMQSHGAKRTPEGETIPLFLCMLPCSRAVGDLPEVLFVMRSRGLSQMAGLG
jgi:hypothetical protein